MLASFPLPEVTMRSNIFLLSLVLLLSSGCSQLASLHPAIADIEESIRGREQEPAEQVFRNIEIFRGMPAERVLELMTNSFSPALGVTCGHCHVSGEWHLDDKEPKRIARDMWRMTGDINKRVQEIAAPDARVRCLTCHQRSPKPPA
jgi:hypothetical protein